MTTKPHAALTTLCRETLASLRNGPRRSDNLSPTALCLLRRRGLVAEYTEGLVEALPCAAGYCADPSTFEV